MKRYLIVVLLGAMAALAVWFPDAAEPSTGPVPGTNPPPVAICPAIEGQGRSTVIDVLSHVSGPGRLTAFASGGSTGQTRFELTSKGSVRVPVIDVAAIGVVGGLAEVPDPAAGVGSLITGTDSVAAEACPSTPSREYVLAGGSTLSGESLEIQMMNPYAGDAAVTLTVVSESGIEANQVFDNVVVPSRSSAVVDLGVLLPGRRVISVLVEATAGSVIAVGRLDQGSDSALWNAVEPGQEWYVVAPGGSHPREVVIASASPGEVSYEVDMYGPDGLVEGYAEGVIENRGTARINLRNVSNEPVAFRIFGSGPIAPFLRFDPDSGIAMTGGARVPVTRWILPGAAGVRRAGTRVLIANPGNGEATVNIEGTGGSGEVDGQVVVPPGGVGVYVLPEGVVHGLFVESDLPVVSMWFMQSGDSYAISTGVPLADG